MSSGTKTEFPSEALFNFRLEDQVPEKRNPRTGMASINLGQASEICHYDGQSWRGFSVASPHGTMRDEIPSFTNESPPVASEGGLLLVREWMNAWIVCVCSLTRTGIGGRIAAVLEWAI